MDLLRTMASNRQAQGLESRKKEEVIERPMVSSMISPMLNSMAQHKAPGSKAMRKYIIEETPAKKVVKKHLEAIITAECESSSEEEN